MEWKSLFNFYSDGVEVVFVHFSASCIEVNRVGIFLLIRLEIYRENVIRHKYPLGKVNTVAMESWLRLQNKYMGSTSSARWIWPYKLSRFWLFLYDQKCYIILSTLNQGEKEKCHITFILGERIMATMKKTMKLSKTMEIVMDAMFIAMVFAATWLINIRLPLVGSGGLIHLGNVPLFIGAMLFGRKTGAISGAFGMALFDVVSGWTAWAPFTFVIVGAMGYVIGWIAEKKPFKMVMVNHVLSVILAIAIKVAGYYFAEVILYGNWITPMGSIPGNVLQVGVAGVVAFVSIEPLKKIIRLGGAA